MTLVVPVVSFLKTAISSGEKIGDVRMIFFLKGTFTRAGNSRKQAGLAVFLGIFGGKNA
jgi:hypothetical protein